LCSAISWAFTFCRWWFSHLRPGGEEAYPSRASEARSPLGDEWHNALEGKLYMLEQERAFKGEDVERFLKHLMPQIEGKLLVIWEGSSIHRSQAVKDFLWSEAALLGCN
jgi:hypothetical protein